MEPGTENVMPLGQLPMEIRLLIAENTMESWRQLCLVFSDIGRYSLEEQVQWRMKQKFVYCALLRLERTNFSVVNTLSESNPYALAIDKNGLVYCSTGVSVDVFDPSSKNSQPIRNIPIKGKQTWGMCLNSKTQTIFIRCKRNYVGEYGLDGSLIKEIHAKEAEDIRGVAVDPVTDRIFVCNYSYSRPSILVYSTVTGEFVAEFKSDDLGAPDSIAVDGLGRILVSDERKNHLVFLSKIDGRVLMKISNFVNEKGVSDSLRTPYGVAVDAQNNVFLVDNGHQRILIFNKNGKFVKTVPSFKKASSTFLSCIAVDHNHNLYSGDFNSKSIRIL